MPTKKHFELIARVLREELCKTWENRDRAMIGRLADRFADYFGEQNPRFDRDRFMRAIFFE